jgi:hypothetical protein
MALGAARVGSGTAARVLMAAPSVGATPAGKHRDQAVAIIRKHEEPPQGGSFYFCALANVGLWHLADVGLTRLECLLMTLLRYQ